jgi:hypothetical protein
MGIEMIDITLLLIAHFIGDFILQTDEQAKGKSSDNAILVQHVVTYIIPFTILALVIPMTAVFLVLNVVLHFITDYISSRMTKKFWAEGRTHEFFVVIGADQLIHTLTLIWTYHLLV